ncbi:MAG: hypothetical protein ACT4OX_01030 [Actinomycetota bacterium]
MVPGGVRFLDEDGGEVTLDPAEAAAIWCLTNAWDAATISACPDCRGRVLAAVAFIDVIDASQPHPRTGDLLEFADDAPTLHLYVEDIGVSCDHRRWRDPLHDEWLDVVDAADPPVRR